VPGLAEPGAEQPAVGGAHQRRRLRRLQQGARELDGHGPGETLQEYGGVNDEPADACPSDFNDCRVTNLSDVMLMGPVYNQPTGTDPAKKRLDLNASGTVNLSDVVLIGPFYNKSCG
jgi:hypothetical protein